MYCMFTHIMHQIESPTTTEQIQQLIASEEFLSLCLDCGYAKPCTRIVIEDKEDIIQIIALDYLVHRVQAEIDQIAEGL